MLREALDFYPLINLCSALRVEWLKARARRDRWVEEVALLSAELARTATFFDTRADWWVSIADMRSNVSPELADGLHAYAARQADIQHQRAAQVRSQHHAARDVDSTSSGHETLAPPSSVCQLSADYLQLFK